MALKEIHKINLRLKFLQCYAVCYVMLLFNLTLIMHRQPVILTSPKK